MYLILPSHEEWMNQAIELALSAAARNEVPVGAVLIHDNRIIGAGSNARESSRRTVGHAEILALDDYNKRTGEWRLPADTSLYVTAEPCMMCTGALLWARVDKLYYGCRDPKSAGLERFFSLISSGTFDHQFLEVAGGLLGDRCSDMMSNFFRAKRTAKKAETNILTQL